MKVGERVRHQLHGDGVVKFVFARGFAEVQFGISAKTVDIGNLKSLDEAEARRQHRIYAQEKEVLVACND